MPRHAFRHDIAPLPLAATLVASCALLLPSPGSAHGDANGSAAPAGSARAAVAPLPPAIGGQWSEVVDWPVIAVHAALLPNGKVLAWDATPDDFEGDPHAASGATRVTLWDPLTDTHVPTYNDTGSDLFCAGSAHLWDGRVLFSAGDAAGESGPIVDSNLYDYRTNTWLRTESLNAPRWYSSVAALANGEMLTWGGHYDPDPLGEVFGFDQVWRPLGIVPPFDQRSTYQWLQAVSGGTVLMFGPQNRLDSIDTRGQGALLELGERDDAPHRDYGSYAMFAPDRILVTGGGDYQPIAGAVVVDAVTNTTSPTDPMNFARRQHDLTILADGTVLASGGQASDKRFVDAELAVLEPESWDPVSGQWRLLNPMARSRQYHSSTLLLPDGRVLSGGGGICGDCRPIGYSEQNAEIYSPPYLFDASGAPADRPALSDVPADAGYGERLAVGVAHARPIARAHLIKLGSVTHSTNQDQRLVPLEIEANGDVMVVRLPTSRDAAPPGHYLLIAVDDAGVPSPGAMIRVGQPLVAPGDTVAGVSPGGEPDLLEVALATTGATFALESDASVSLRVATGRAAATDPDGENLCRLEPDAEGTRTCTLDALVDETLFVAVTSPERHDYRLAIGARGSALVDDVPAEPPVDASLEPPAGTTVDAGGDRTDEDESAPDSGAPVLANDDSPAPDAATDAAPDATVDTAAATGTDAVAVGAGGPAGLLALFALLLARSRSSNRRLRCASCRR